MAFGNESLAQGEWLMPHFFHMTFFWHRKQPELKNLDLKNLMKKCFGDIVHVLIIRERLESNITDFSQFEKSKWLLV